MRTLLLVLVLAACGGSGGDPATAPEATGPTCADASANAGAELAGQESGITAEQRTQLEALFAKSCADDNWSAEAIRCVADSKGDEMESCESLIPAETHDRVRAEIEVILGEGHRVDEEPPPPTP